MTVVAEKLREAKALIEAGWTKHVFADTRNGKTCFCTTGAITQAIGGECYAEEWQGDCEFDAAIETFARAIGVAENWQDVADWNDKQRSKRSVLTAFDKAIALAEAGQ